MIRIATNEGLTFIDLFAGIGGFRRGMELAGHKCLGYCEWDKFASASYRSMHTITEEQREYLATLDLKKRQKEIMKDEYLNGEWYANDIRTVYAGDIPKADVWCLGFPCQDISVAGKQVGFYGNRSSLFFRVMYLLGQQEEEKRPIYLFIENVKNLLSVNGGWDFARLLAEMDRGGYDAEWQVLNSKHFGVPQNRERCFIIGHLRGRSTTEIFPVEGTDGENNIHGIDHHMINVIGNSDGFGHSINGRIYSADGQSPCLNGIGNGGNHEPKVGIEVITVGNTNPSGSGKMQNDIKLYFRSRSTAEIFPVEGTDGENNIHGIGHRNGYRRNTQIFDPDGITETMDTGAGGGRGHHTIISIGKQDANRHSSMDIHSPEGIMSCIDTLHEPKRVAVPVLTPERANKRQNGRRFKEDGEEAFTLTSQDRHGVAVGVDDLCANRNPRFYDEEIPTIRSDRQGLKVAVEVEPVEMSGNKISECEDNEAHALNCSDQRKVFGENQRRNMVGYNATLKQGGV